MGRTGELQLVSLKAATLLNWEWLEVISKGEAELEEDQDVPLQRSFFFGLLRSEPILLLVLLCCL